MSSSNPLLWPRPPVIWGYGIAVLSVTAALIISRWPALHLQDAPVSLFLCAVILSAWFGGAGPGLLATALSAFAFYYYFLPPIYSLAAKPEEIPRLLVFTVSALFVGLLSAAQRGAMESLRRARDELKETVQEVQRTNEALQAESRERRRAEEASRQAQADLVSRIRLLFKKGTPQQELVDVNEVVREMIVLLRGEATRYNISVWTELAAELPQVLGDRVQLQQVLMNLIMNSIDAMKDVEGTRELAIKSQRAENEQVLVTVSDTGVGLPPQQADQIFKAFFTTKSHGTGMGLRISRSIVESHGGRLWATDNSPRGASFCFALSTKAEAHE